LHEILEDLKFQFLEEIKAFIVCAMVAIVGLDPLEEYLNSQPIAFYVNVHRAEGLPRENYGLIEDMAQNMHVNRVSRQSIAPS